MILYVGCIISYFVFDTYCIKDHVNGDRPISHKATDQKKQHFHHLWIHQVACDQLGAGRGTREERPKHSPAQVVNKVTLYICSYPARALRALGLLLADGAPIVGGGKTF